MILISNTCINSIIYKNYYKKPYNNPFVNCFIGIKDFIRLVAEYESSMKDSWKFYVEWSIERKLIDDDFRYIKMLIGVFDDKIKIHYLHDTNRKYSLEYTKEHMMNRHKRWLDIKNKELTIFTYVQHPLDTKEDIYRLINVKLGNKCRLRIYTSYLFHSDNENIDLVYVKALKSPIKIFTKDNYSLNPINDILRKECFNFIVNDLCNYLKENNIEYNS